MPRSQNRLPDFWSKHVLHLFCRDWNLDPNWKRYDENYCRMPILILLLGLSSYYLHTSVQRMGKDGPIYICFIRSSARHPTFNSIKFKWNLNWWLRTKQNCIKWKCWAFRTELSAFDIAREGHCFVEGRRDMAKDGHRSGLLPEVERSGTAVISKSGSVLFLGQAAPNQGDYGKAGKSYTKTKGLIGLVCHSNDTAYDMAERLTCLFVTFFCLEASRQNQPQPGCASC